MRASFRYGLDPVCLCACVLYLANSFLIPAHGGYRASYLNDLLMMPCALPWVLWLHRRLGWRAEDRPPTVAETGGHLLVWALIAEVAGPRLFAHAVGDPLDVLAYSVGAILALFLWHAPLGGLWPASCCLFRRLGHE